jgi:hypothetical protein
MSIREAEEKFTNIWRFAFQCPTSHLTDTINPLDYCSRNSSRLESIIRVLLGQKGLRKDLELLGSTNGSLAKRYAENNFRRKF